MRLLIVGSLDGHISAAGKIALSRGAKVAHVNDVDQAMHALRNGQGADLVMFDVNLDVQRMIESLKRERINLPVSLAASAPRPRSRSARSAPARRSTSRSRPMPS